jgi:hypothetical protein
MLKAWTIDPLSEQYYILGFSSGAFLNFSKMTGRMLSILDGSQPHAKKSVDDDCSDWS